MPIRTVIVSGMRSSTTGSGFVADSNSSTTTLVNCNDTDNDGLLDGVEDSDSDGVPLIIENVWGTSDTNVDSDGDIIPDGMEMGPLTRSGTTSPSSDDTDGDGTIMGDINQFSYLELRDSIPAIMYNSYIKMIDFLFPFRISTGEPTSSLHLH